MTAAGEPLTRARLAPTPHALVRFPDGRPLPPEGEEVDVDAWWIRRLLDADVVIVTADEPLPPSPKASTRRSRGQRKEQA